MVEVVIVVVVEVEVLLLLLLLLRRAVVVVRRDTVVERSHEGHGREKQEGCYGARLPWRVAARRAGRAGSRGRLLD